MAMKKIVTALFAIISSVIAFAVIFWSYRPFAQSYINALQGVGDSATHLANITTFVRHHPFPIVGWQGEWFAGYPLVEGYPWLHYYTIQPFLSLFSSTGLAMDYYAVILLLFYYFFCFVLLYYVSKNPILALLFSLIIVYGADHGMSLYVNAFTVFTASQFFLPLTLLVILVARQRDSNKLFLLAAITLSLAFYAHAAMVGIVVMPIIFPFLIFDKEGRVNKATILRTIRYFVIFALLSSIQVYQYITYSLYGQDISSIKPHPLADIPTRYGYMFSWQNPVLLFVIIALVPLFIAAARKSFSRLKPYLISFLFILIIFSLMVFKITAMVVVILAERALWGVSLMLLVLMAAVIRELFGSKKLGFVFVTAVSVLLTAIYIYLTSVIKMPNLVPDIHKQDHPYENRDFPKRHANYSSKYSWVYDYPPLSWNQSFDNYRTDGLSYNIYSSWALWSENPRYKGRYPAMKGLPLHWSGLVSGAEYGMLGEAGAFDSSQWAIKQALFFFDWYGIRHFEIGEGDPDLAQYLRKEPLISSTEKSFRLTYHSLDKKYVGPIYAPTNAKTMAVVAPEKQYDNFIRTLSYTGFDSQKVIPIHLGSNLSFLKKNDFSFYDSIFIYGYKDWFAFNIWETLADYVKGGGSLVIETGQKVPQSEGFNLPEIFPINKTKLAVVDQAWDAKVVENEITKNIIISDFEPLKYKYLPYAISVADEKDLREWAKPVLLKERNVVLAYGQLGKGKVIWSGLNLPFHAIDNRNMSETTILANTLSWLFPAIDKPIEDFEVSHPSFEEIIVKSNSGKGVLIKEHFNPGWQAHLDGRRARIFKAGLYLMYVPFAGEGEHTLSLSYRGEPIHWLLFLIMLITFLVSCIYLVFNKNLVIVALDFFKIRERFIGEEN